MALIDYLISLSEDESPEVSEKAHNVLQTISDNYMQNHDMKSLIDSLEDKFYSFLTRLPTIIRRSGKIFLLVTKVKSFLFYIIKHNRINYLLQFTCHKKRLGLQYKLNHTYPFFIY